MRKWAIISVMSKDHGYGRMEKKMHPFPDQTYTVVKFYESEDEARKLFKDCPQGQSFESGEINRLLVHVEEAF